MSRPDISKWLAFKGATSSFTECVDRKALSIIHEAVITVTNQIRLWALEKDGLPKPFERFWDVFPAAIFVLVFLGLLE